MLKKVITKLKLCFSKTKVLDDVNASEEFEKKKIEEKK
jgi:hypothetical protein